MKCAISLTISLASMLYVTFPALADPVPPGVYECSGMQPGDSCTYNGATGNCQSMTCSRYENGGVVSYGCLHCVPGPATATTTSTTTATATGTATSTDSNPPANDDGSCSIARSITAERVAPWLLAASFWLLFLFRRRRRS
jgi:hypothetical protein